MAKKVLRKKRAPRKNRLVDFVSPEHDKLAGASVTYQLERVQCGKPRCRKWHGPYWYAYWSAGGRTRSLYVGLKLRPAAEVASELVERRRAKATAAAAAEGEPT